MTSVPQTTAPSPADCDPARCPLCGGANDCRLCTSAAYKGPCWCESVNIPPALLVRVPTEARNRACICRDCVAAFHDEGSRRRKEADSQRESCGVVSREVAPPH